MYVLDLSKMILADDEGKLHWKYTVYIYSHIHIIHIQYSHTDTLPHTHIHTHRIDVEKVSDGGIWRRCIIIWYIHIYTRGVTDDSGG